jgi:hypothetical protein
MSLKNSIIHNLQSIPGARVRRRIVVIESDDWGSIRMPSRVVRDSLYKKGYRINSCAFSKYDCLASSDDLLCLFEILSSVKDKNDNPAVITANAVVANPDFQKIAECNFSQYYFEPFTETLKRYPSSHAKSFELWHEGISNNIFHPQLHGREHLNVIRWMKALQDNDKVTKLCFEQEHFSLSNLTTSELKVRYMDAFCNATEESVKIEEKIVNDAARLFSELFGYKSESFIAPCYIWRDSLEQVLNNNGVLFLQGLSLQQVPIKDVPPMVKTRYHYLGQKNRLGQSYLIRNAFFEPYKNNQNDTWVNECLSRINIAFRWHKPAIISSHRLNFIGSIDTAFRDRNLLLLRSLLQQIVKKWPDVEFMTSDQLGRLINEN